MREFHILNLGAGVQSTTIYLLAVDGELGVSLDAAVFADTHEEPTSVYRHLEWLESLGGPKIHRVSAGKIGDDLVHGINSTGHSFASIPCHTSDGNGRTGITRRQCTAEYKIRPIEKWIRQTLVGIRKGQWMPKDVKVNQYMGFSYDEPGRAARARNRFAQIRWGEVHFPLIELEMTRAECESYLRGRVPHHVPRSACVFCPYKSNAEWLHLKANDPDGWKRAVQVDASLRDPNSVATRGATHSMFIHRQCVPLPDVDLGESPNTSEFEMECEGGCGL